MAELWTSSLLTAAKRLRNSRSGNPRWQLRIGGMSYTTELDTDVANRIDFGHRVPELCTFRLNRAGRLIGYEGDGDKERQSRLRELQIQFDHTLKLLDRASSTFTVDAVSTYHEAYLALKLMPLETMSNLQLREVGTQLAELQGRIRAGQFGGVIQP